MAVMDSYADGELARAYGETGYVLCGLAERGIICDRRRNHSGQHLWELKPDTPRPPHGCLEDRMAALERKVAALQAQVDRGPDPRLWSDDPHDGGYRTRW